MALERRSVVAGRLLKISFRSHFISRNVHVLRGRATSTLVAYFSSQRRTDLRICHSPIKAASKGGWASKRSQKKWKVSQTHKSTLYVVALMGRFCTSLAEMQRRSFHFFAVHEDRRFCSKSNHISFRTVHWWNQRNTSSVGVIVSGRLGDPIVNFECVDERQIKIVVGTKQRPYRLIFAYGTKTCCDRAGHRLTARSWWRSRKWRPGMSSLLHMTSIVTLGQRSMIKAVLEVSLLSRD